MGDYINKKKKPNILIIILALVVVLALIGFIVVYYFKTHKSETLPNQENVKESYDIEANRNLQNEVRALNATYNDGIAWIKIPGSSIDAPVFKGTTNEKYFGSDREENEKKYGELFMDYRCNLNNMDTMSHFIIYGHNTEDGKYFSDLLNYKKEDYFKNHQTIYMSTINGNYKWQIFSVYTTNTDFFYIDVNFNNVTEYGMFLDTLKEKSMYNTNVSINNSDTILTLSTCDYSIDDGRFVVQAKLIK